MSGRDTSDTPERRTVIGIDWQVRPDPDMQLLEQVARAAKALERIASVLEHWHNEYQIDQEVG